jgi:hypothetical protein
MRRLWIALWVGALYVSIGVSTATISGRATDAQARTAWRLAAWLLSLAAFAAQIAYELRALRRPPRSAAADSAFAAALGAFGLAVVAAARAIQHGVFGARYLAALALWPLVILVPALIVGLALAALLRPREGRGK